MLRSEQRDERYREGWARGYSKDVEKENGSIDSSSNSSLEANLTAGSRAAVEWKLKARFMFPAAGLERGSVYVWMPTSNGLRKRRQRRKAKEERWSVSN